MTNAKQKIAEKLTLAMKNKDAEAISIFRVFKGEIERAEQSSSGKVELSDTEISKLAKRMIENIKESKGSEKEMEILGEFVPKQLGPDEIFNLAFEFVASADISSMKEMGKVMQHFKSNYDGLYDGKVLSDACKKILSVNV